MYRQALCTYSTRTAYTRTKSCLPAQQPHIMVAVADLDAVQGGVGVGVPAVPFLSWYRNMSSTAILQGNPCLHDALANMNVHDSTHDWSKQRAQRADHVLMCGSRTRQCLATTAPDGRP